MCVKGGIMKCYIDVCIFDVYFFLFWVVCFCFNKWEGGGGGGVLSFVVLYVIIVVKLFFYYLDLLFCNDGIYI